MAERAVPSWLLAEVDGGARQGRVAAALEAEAPSRQASASSLFSNPRCRTAELRLGTKGCSGRLAARPVRVASLTLVGSRAGAPEIPPYGSPHSVAPPTAAPIPRPPISIYASWYRRDTTCAPLRATSVSGSPSQRTSPPCDALQVVRFRFKLAVSLEDLPGAVDRALVPLATAATRALPVGRLTERGAARARLGQTLSLADFDEPPPIVDTSAWLDSQGRLVAVGERRAAPTELRLDESGESAFAIHRGFLS